MNTSRQFKKYVRAEELGRWGISRYWISRWQRADRRAKEWRRISNELNWEIDQQAWWLKILDEEVVTKRGMVLRQS